MREGTPLMEARNLTKEYRVKSEKSLFSKPFTAVRDVNLQVYPGETLGIVGESGCGKSTVARLMMLLEKPTKGEIWIGGARMDQVPERELRKRRTEFQMVFQDSGSSLNPRKRVREIIEEPMRYHRIAPEAEIPQRTAELLEMVGLPTAMAERYPHEFSGGQRQRICIARALSLRPKALVLDEPVSALDVSVQAQILNLLRDLQRQLGTAYVFIGHGLGAVHYISDRVAVMYRGSIVEEGPSEALFAHPAHPYTRALLDAAPVADDGMRDRARLALKEEIDQEAPAGACPLYPRCPLAEEACLHYRGEMRELAGEQARRSACNRAWER
ncbi:MAG: ATP-binding cassette domain-containing protein [Clostridia bacterium]|nr:ATP-binding cassette domain-containing protein [Clostridia bacterium]